MGSSHAVALERDPVPQLGQRPQLADLLDEADAGVDEERDRADDGREPVRRHLARVPHGVQHAHGVGQGVGHLLHGGRARLLQVVAADVDRVPRRRVLAAPGDDVDGEPAAGTGRVDVGAARQVLLDDVVLRGAPQVARRDALLLGVGHVEPEQPGRRGVDGHRGVHGAGRDAVHERAHVPEVGDGDTDLAHLAPGQRMVGVVPGLGGQVEGDGQAGLSLGQVGAVERVRGRGRRVPRVGPHHPRPVAHGISLPRSRADGHGVPPVAALGDRARHGGGSAAAGRADQAGRRREMAGQIVASGTTFGRHDVGRRVAIIPPMATGPHEVSRASPGAMG